MGWWGFEGTGGLGEWVLNGLGWILAGVGLVWSDWYGRTGMVGLV